MKDCLLVLALLGLFAWLYKGTVAGAPYVYDESDYMYAASMGLRANYAERPTLPFPDFIRAGLKRADRSTLSEMIRDNNDIVFYRHWHGPLLAYWLMAIGGRHFDEFQTRSSMIVFHLLTFVLIYAGCRSIFEGRLPAVLCSAMYLVGFSNIRAASGVFPHSMFVLTYLACLFCFAKLVSGGTHWRYPVAVTAALAFCSLEVTIALVAALVICCFVFRQELAGGWRLAVGPSLAFIATVLIVWPGAWLKLSFLKAYLFMAYLAVARTSAWGSSLSVADTWRLRFTSSPVEWILIVAAFLLFLFARKPAMRATLPFLIYGGCMIVLVARVNADDPRYLSPFLPALQVFAGAVLAIQFSRFTAAVRSALTVVVVLILVANSHRQFRANPIKGAPAEYSALADLRARDLRGKTILVPAGWVPMVHYYIPGVHVRGYADSGAIPRDGVDGILYDSPDVRFESR